MKKKNKLGFIAKTTTITLLTNYINSQVHEAVKRYDIQQLSFESEHYVLTQCGSNKDVKGKCQQYYDYQIRLKDSEEVIGTARLYLSQEQNSYYNGHIKVDFANSTEEQLCEIYNALIKMAKEKMMHHLYFVCNKKDKASIALYTKLNATYLRDITIPTNLDSYNAKEKVRKQYRLNLVKED